MCHAVTVVQWLEMLYHSEKLQAEFAVYVKSLQSCYVFDNHRTVCYFLFFTFKLEVHVA